MNNNATRLINALRLTEEDDELRDLVWKGFYPVIASVFKTPKNKRNQYPTIMITIFLDKSSIIEYKGTFFIMDTAEDFLYKLSEIFDYSAKNTMQFIKEFAVTEEEYLKRDEEYLTA